MEKSTDAGSEMIAHKDDSLKPDTILSSKRTRSPSPPVFDEKDYADLTKRFLEERVYRDEELPSGMTLRKKPMPPFIDTNQPGFKALKAKIEKLQQEENHAEIYQLLKQLRDWQVYNRGIPTVCCEKRVLPVGACQMYDLTEDDPEIIDVDKYIVDVVLLLVVKANPDDSSNNVAAAVKSEPVESKRALMKSKPGDQFVRCITESTRDFQVAVILHTVRLTTRM